MIKHKLLMTASVWSHIQNFHLPYLREFKRLGWETHVGCAGIPAEAPWSGSAFDLLADQWIEKTGPVLREGVKPEEAEKATEGGKRNQTLYAELTSLAEELNRYVRSLEGHSNRELEQMANRLRKLLP